MSEKLSGKNEETSQQAPEELVWERYENDLRKKLGPGKQSWEALNAVIGQIEGIQTKKGEYLPSKILKESIEIARQTMQAGAVTRTGGLRDIVVSLILREK